LEASSFKIAMGDAFLARELEVRKHTTDELPWQEIVKQI
jgi:hypothetical protein